MSWDVSVQRFSREYSSIEDIPNTERCIPLGSQSEVRSLISEYFPGTDWTEPAWGIFNSFDGTVEFNMGKDEPNTGFMMHVRASPAVVNPMIAMCRSYNLQALDGTSGQFLEKATDPAGSLKQWIEYRNQIVGTRDA